MTKENKMAELSLNENQSKFNLIPDRIEINEEEYDKTKNKEKNQFLSVSTAFGSSAGLPLTRRVSAKLEPEAIKPILAPCCSCKNLI